MKGAYPVTERDIVFLVMTCAKYFKAATTTATATGAPLCDARPEPAPPRLLRRPRYAEEPPHEAVATGGMCSLAGTTRRA